MDFNNYLRGGNSLIISMFISIINFNYKHISYFMLIVDANCIDYTLNFIIKLKK